MTEESKLPQPALTVIGSPRGDRQGDYKGAPQGEIPFARVQGEPYLQPPTDLYIPPDALEILLEAFEGPLDLLLYLIRRQNLNILDIPVAEITRQYMEYIDLMQELRLELAAEYLLMAAMLAEIKSRMLLPRPDEGDEDEDDPRAELIRRLQEYERYKKAAEDLDTLPRLERDFVVTHEIPSDHKVVRLAPKVNLKDVLSAFGEVMRRADLYTRHHIQRERLSVRERMSRVLGALREGGYEEFQTMFTVEEGRMGVVVTLLAMLELIKEELIELVQNEPYGPIYVKSLASHD
ncbi:MAG: segregation/condensation protein A [Gammaproteobacteria bacterium]|nr:MAG: segregation/condensation protein A [Gammaproteobacteria bacterium]